ncbi:calcium-binding protein [Rhizobium sp. ARZ01]|uniref:calcium-binding protein n=1 Tax=Rhizobium sp. ARZ01 TaxID=2769313 RepID=UPI00177E2D84|nr:calcium-binding protein [Rhizobium sp. ARZ01]MBD9373991.1 calcium-binding protein [Rhizobium sp. ARZ01]
MAIHITKEDSATPITASAAFDTWLIQEGVTLATSPVYGAIDASAKANSRKFIVEGNVFADGVGVYLGEGTDTKIVVGDTGSVMSSSTAMMAWAPGVEATLRLENDGEIYGSQEGIYVLLTQFDLTNNGTIGGGFSAVVARSNFTYIVNNGVMNGLVAAYGNAAGKAAINNTGTINGRLEVLTHAAQVNTILNTGTIAAHDKLGGSQDAVGGGLATELVVNTGTIRGNIRLGGGGDNFSNAGYVIGAVLLEDGDDGLTLNVGGVIDGDVRMGGGSDRLALNGGSVAGRVYGGLGDDYYFVGNADVVLTEFIDQGVDTVETRATWYLDDNFENLVLAGNAGVDGHGNTLANTLTGNIASNRLFGYEGDDVLDGGKGADRLEGGLGNDTYIVDNAQDVVFEGAGAGIDHAKSSVSYMLAANVENLTLTGNGTINGAGNTLSNVLTGNVGANILNGGVGADRLVGGAGNDTYIVDNAKDVVVEDANAGTDTVKSTVSLVLAANVENLVLGGSAALNGTGNALANTLTGNSGRNVLNGGTGKDTLIGGAGNDTYITDGGDTIKEDAKGGIDLVKSSATVTLGAYLENLMLTGTSNIGGTGNSLNNVLLGNAGKNVLNGGAGADTLTGGRGSDTFVFNSGLGSKNVDKISDFDTKADLIHLDDAIFLGLKAGALAAGAFRIGTAAADASDRIIYNDATGALSFDRDGSGSAYKAVQFAVLSPNLKAAGIAYSDFFII